MLEKRNSEASAYWREELTNIDYLLDASPLVVNKLRHHCYHITGVRPYDYRSGSQPQRGQIARRIDELRRVGGDDLLIPESAALGGFGYELDGGLFNLDTVKFYESLIAMRISDVIDPLRSEADPIILEIGGGWGGMAYQIKTLIPHATYIIVDLPELFLLSATYLSTVFPGSVLSFFGHDSSWSDADFVFVSESDFRQFKPTHLSLAINMVSFQEMTTEQVTQYMSGLVKMGVQVVYSLNRPRSIYNTQLTSSHQILREHFDVEAIDPVRTSYNEIARPPNDRRAALARALGRRRNEYRHHVGRPRS
jgi:hypothetical protein